MINNDMKTLQDLTINEDYLHDARFNELINLFTLQHFSTIQTDSLPFYRTTFWCPSGHQPEATFENVIENLCSMARPSAKVVGSEWWFGIDSIKPHRDGYCLAILIATISMSVMCSVSFFPSGSVDLLEVCLMVNSLSLTSLSKTLIPPIPCKPSILHFPPTRFIVMITNVTSFS